MTSRERHFKSVPLRRERSLFSRAHTQIETFRKREKFLSTAPEQKRHYLPRWLTATGIMCIALITFTTGAAALEHQTPHTQSWTDGDHSTCQFEENETQRTVCDADVTITSFTHLDETQRNGTLHMSVRISKGDQEILSSENFRSDASDSSQSLAAGDAFIHTLGTQLGKNVTLSVLFDYDQNPQVISTSKGNTLLGYSEYIALSNNQQNKMFLLSFTQKDGGYAQYEFGQDGTLLRGKDFFSDLHGFRTLFIGDQQQEQQKSDLLLVKEAYPFTNKDFQDGIPGYIAGFGKNRRQ
ncbi:hypothetical protein C5B42_06050 [Candidatus Cerribacteria bacterium 'Amazon FNV 2010 28 9']|uniref:Uncharacterized protein n=1 Tax=Candidatus Cerribacteria bacterium 'Amazon FNV 2010 28 9' TaxID=2081795 RepID=A0A317JN29_9BACT|nr:MAG: hypothetical protein C5B42_06050 [Candidatus Cerribacteria bacterium 'Amazon FNV 2010 28 9']